MSLRDRILFEVHGDINKINTKEDDRRNFNSFLEGFMEDAREYGLDEATDMYGMLFGKDAKEHLNELKEDFENYIGNSLNEIQLPDVAAQNLGNAFKSIGSSGAHDGDTVARLLASAGNTSGVIDKEAARGVVNAAMPHFGDGSGGLMTKLMGLWGVVKGFFKGGWNSLVSVFSGGGNVGEIMSKLGSFAVNNPLFTGIAGLGGILAVKTLAKTLKLLFGKMGKKAPSAKVQEQLLKQENLMKELEIIKSKKAKK